MKNKSYDYIFGNGKFNTWFNIIVSIISCSAISFCLTELLFSFDFKVSFQKALIFTILFVIFLLLFYYFIKQRTYKLFDQKITYGFRERKILYADIHSLVFTLSSRPKGIYDIGLGEPYLYIKENGKKNGRIVRKFPVCIIGIWMPTDYCTFRNTPDCAVLFVSA